MAEALSDSIFMAACAFASSASSAATSDSTALSSASAELRSPMALSRRASAIFNWSIFGLTILAAPWYITMAPTNLQRPAAAPLALPANSGSSTLWAKGLQFLTGSGSYRKYGSNNSQVSSLMLSFSLAANSKMCGRKFMSWTSLLAKDSYESARKNAVHLLIDFSSNATSTTFFAIKICRPSKVNLMMSNGFLLDLISTMSFFEMELQADSASCKNGSALSNSTCASAFSALILSASPWQSAFCPFTTSAFLSALPFSIITLSKRAMVFFSSALSTTSCSLSCTFNFSTNSEASFNFCRPTLTLRS
mmetsp:Transcript_120676/g.385320  ORF Transcript_120676/g.385320 Transcript_120676/m.385320 type:complete len:307 (+) Transcript_120676:632-1552(+)